MAGPYTVRRRGVGVCCTLERGAAGRPAQAALPMPKSYCSLRTTVGHLWCRGEWQGAQCRRCLGTCVDLSAALTDGVLHAIHRAVCSVHTPSPPTGGATAPTDSTGTALARQYCNTAWRHATQPHWTASAARHRLRQSADHADRGLSQRQRHSVAKQCAAYIDVIARSRNPPPPAGRTASRCACG
jgi:hypothetical protein